MKQIIKNTVILFAITLIAGAFLGYIYEITKAPRAAQELKAIQSAYKAVYKSADSFENYDFDSIEVAKSLDLQGINSDMAKINEVVLALDEEGKMLGYVITVTSKEGYAGDIKYTVGVRSDKTVTGISFLNISETAGLGMKAKDPEFAGQFENKSVDAFEYTKTGAEQDNQIDAITGATITSKAVTNGVNAAIYCFDYISWIGGGAIE